MRRPTLERWLRREIMALAGVERFSLRKLAAMAQGPVPRLREPLLLYCRETGRLESLQNLIYDESLVESYEAAIRAVAGLNLTELALSGNATQLLPREYAKHLDSFATEWHRQDTLAESKRMRLERCRDLQLRKGVSVAEICRAVGIDPGNASAFLRRGDLGRVTLEDATAMMRYLMSA